MQKEMIFLKGYAKGKNLNKTLSAINLAIAAHSDQYRRTGEPYITHPIKVTMHLLSLGLDNDELLASSLLHDTVEDCDVKISEICLNVSRNVSDTVDLVTKSCNISTQTYYRRIEDSIEATLIKIADRCHNVSTMAEVFTKEKIREYIKETNDYVIPLCKYAIKNYPEYSDQIIVMRYHIESVCSALTICLDALERQEKELKCDNTEGK